MNLPLKGCTYLITGIIDSGSLALTAAKQIVAEGGEVICTGLGKTPFHQNLSEKAQGYLDSTYSAFQETVRKELGTDVLTFPLDVTIDESINSFSKLLAEKNISLSGFLHSIAMDKTIKAGVVVKSILEVTKEEFFSAMDVSAYSLVSLTRSLLNYKVLKNNASILALSYLGAEKVVYHPYRNIGVAKAALERIVIEMAYELGRSHQIKVNCIRFSPYTGSKAGSAIQGLQEAVNFCNENSPLGNALPEDLAYESAYLLRPYGRITGEIRYVDGGYHIRG
ncbi:MAG TPA: SDR family oxidoreductase [Leptospiraceae bacterium]|nr:SDR family oxidoreductase [Leptospiraceae bacterium]HNF24546.1 SDR family oxidoreductase [Leptospiraceae bacterium]HNH11229.1 SDR family oxidoreductase [Leptospiraceae bacterium]HNI96514.1 SDR family oxidoreductase [Leptospiraceae bacterium]HNM03079.1 SDR family oxidoreductase [Leptospiraceae bacterium]